MGEAALDVELVAGLRADRQAGFDALYRSYAERLYAYAVTVLRDRDAAEDAAHEALIAAVANIDRLREPERLRPWLFAITRNTCLTALNDGRRLVFEAEPLDTAVHEEDPAAGATADDAGEIVRTAMNALAPADREVLALALRGDLEAAAVAEAMGSNAATARARISRAKGALTESVLGLVLARQQDRACAGLNETLRGFTGEWTPLLRKRVAKHVRNCPQCSEDGNRRAVSYVSAFTLPIVLALPLGARARADELLSRADLAALAGAGAWAPDGFPRPASVAGGLAARRVLPIAAGGAAVLALVLTGVVATSSAEPESAVAGTPSPSPTVAAEQRSADPTKPAAQSRRTKQDPKPGAAISPSAAPTPPGARPDSEAPGQDPGGRRNEDQPRNPDQPGNDGNGAGTNGDPGGNDRGEPRPDNDEQDPARPTEPGDGPGSAPPNDAPPDPVEDPNPQPPPSRDDVQPDPEPPSRDDVQPESDVEPATPPGRLDETPNEDVVR